MQRSVVLCGTVSDNLMIFISQEMRLPKVNSKLCSNKMSRYIYTVQLFLLIYKTYTVLMVLKHEATKGLVHYTVKLCVPVQVVSKQLMSSYMQSF